MIWTKTPWGHIPAVNLQGCMSLDPQKTDPYRGEESDFELCLSKGQGSGESPVIVGWNRLFGTCPPKNFPWNMFSMFSCTFGKKPMYIKREMYQHQTLRVFVFVFFEFVFCGWLVFLWIIFSWFPLLGALGNLRTWELWSLSSFWKSEHSQRVLGRYDGKMARVWEIGILFKCDFCWMAGPMLC